MIDLVACRSETEYPERPVAICFCGEEREIDRVLASWHIPEGKKFLVITQDGEIFNLIFNETNDEWSVQLQISNPIDSAPMTPMEDK